MGQNMKLFLFFEMFKSVPGQTLYRHLWWNWLPKMKQP